MIKVALKHFIFETCIEQLFSAVQKNFMVPKKGDAWTLLVYDHKYNIVTFNHALHINRVWNDVLFKGTSHSKPNCLIFQHRSGEQMYDMLYVSKAHLIEVF